MDNKKLGAILVLIVGLVLLGFGVKLWYNVGKVGMESALLLGFGLLLSGLAVWKLQKKN